MKRAHFYVLFSVPKTCTQPSDLFTNQNEATWRQAIGAYFYYFEENGNFCAYRGKYQGFLGNIAIYNV